MDDRPVFIISVAAELANVHPQTLRIYERKGLVVPKRSLGRNRLYSEKDIEKLKQIQYLTQEIGINLAGVKQIMSLKEKLDEAERCLREAEQKMEDTKKEAQVELAKVLMDMSPQIVKRSAGGLAPTSLEGYLNILKAVLKLNKESEEDER